MEYIVVEAEEGASKAKICTDPKTGENLVFDQYRLALDHSDQNCKLGYVIKIHEQNTNKKS